MRSALFVACVLVFLFSASPAAGQLRADAATIDAPVRLYDAGGTGFSLNRYFSPEHFRMSHGFELSSSSFGGYGGGSMAMYTNSMMWQFSQKLAARVDVAMAYSPDGGAFGGALNQDALGGGNNSRVFLKNAELAYRPKENMLFHFSVRQSPYGSYMSPYGYGYRNPFYSYQPMSSQSRSADHLFWKDGR